MKMRSEFNHIRRYNSQTIKFVRTSNDSNKRIKANLKELEYYKTAKPTEGLNNYYQVLIRQIIINKMIELYEENVGLRIRVDSLSTALKITRRLNELHTVQY